MSKSKVMMKARGAIPRITDHLRLYGQGPGVDSANAIIIEMIEWAWDMGSGDERPCPVNENEIKRRVKW